MDASETHRVTPTPVDPAAASAPVDRVAECEALRADVERLSDREFAVGQALVNEQSRSERAEADRDEARTQLAEARHENERIRTVLYGTEWAGTDPMRMREQLRAALSDDEIAIAQYATDREAAELRARLDAVQARAETAEARISAAFGVIGETGCFCVDDPPEGDCPNHRIEAALLGTWTEAEVADVKRRAHELAERLRPHFEDAPLPDAALASPPEPEADEVPPARSSIVGVRPSEADEVPRDRYRAERDEDGSLRAAPQPVADAPWAVDLIDCGRDDGVQVCATWAEADAFRRSYIEPTDHERIGVIRRAVSGTRLGYHERAPYLAPPAPVDQPVPPTRTAAELLREVAERDPKGHAERLARGYGIGRDPRYYAPTEPGEQATCGHGEEQR